MTATNTPRDWNPAGAPPAGEIAPQSPLAVRSCARLGRTANPPRLALTDWLLAGRRRG